MKTQTKQARYASATESFLVNVHPENEKTVFDALQKIKAHHGGTRLPAIKAAIVLYASTL